MCSSGLLFLVMHCIQHGNIHVFYIRPLESRCSIRTLILTNIIFGIKHLDCKMNKIIILTKMLAYMIQYFACMVRAGPVSYKFDKPIFVKYPIVLLVAWTDCHWPHVVLYTTLGYLFGTANVRWDHNTWSCGSCLIFNSFGG